MNIAKKMIICAMVSVKPIQGMDINQKVYQLKQDMLGLYDKALHIVERLYFDDAEADIITNCLEKGLYSPITNHDKKLALYLVNINKFYPKHFIRTLWLSVLTLQKLRLENNQVISLENLCEYLKIMNELEGELGCIQNEFSEPSPIIDNVQVDIKQKTDFFNELIRIIQHDSSKPKMLDWGLLVKVKNLPPNIITDINHEIENFSSERDLLREFLSKAWHFEPNFFLTIVFRSVKSLFKLFQV